MNHHSCVALLTGRPTLPNQIYEQASHLMRKLTQAAPDQKNTSAFAPSAHASQTALAGGASSAVAACWALAEPSVVARGRQGREMASCFAMPSVCRPHGLTATLAPPTHRHQRRRSPWRPTACPTCQVAEETSLGVRPTSICGPTRRKASPYMCRQAWCSPPHLRVKLPYRPNTTTAITPEPCNKESGGE